MKKFSYQINSVENLYLADGARTRVGEEAVVAVDAEGAESSRIRGCVSYRM